MGTMPGSLCLVAVELDYVVKNGGIGTANWALAHLLAEHGWHVHILYVCPVPDRSNLLDARRRLAGSGIGFTHIDEVPCTPELQATDRIDLFHLNLSEKVRHALEVLQRQHGFDLIEFAEAIGTGFRTIQARRASGFLPGVGLLIKLHSMSQWLREGNQSWMTRGDEVLIDHLERDAFAAADFQVSPSRHLFDYARRIGWRVRDDACVVPYPLPRPTCRPTDRPGPLELVFFGRLEVRKGLDLFLTALDQLDATIPVTFLGRDTLLDNGQRASEHIRQRLGPRHATILTDCNRDQALAYLSSGPRLAILPSLLENYANAVLECVVNGIPFLASAVGGTPEIVPAELHQHFLFAPTPADLARSIQDYVATPREQRDVWQHRLAELRDVDEHNQAVLAQYEGFLDATRAGRTKLKACPQDRTGLQACPTGVTVAVLHRNGQGNLAEVLDAVANQTDSPIEVLVVDDGADSAMLGVLDDLEQRYPRCRFARRPGQAAAWALTEARGEAFLPLDSATILAPTALERFTAALQRNPDWAGVVPYALSVRRPADIAKAKWSGADRPTGGPFILGAIQNIHGESPALYRATDLRKVGLGGAWLTGTRLACAGRTIGVLPEYLGYRLSTSADTYQAQVQVVEEYARCATLPAEERFALWTALVSFHQQRTDCLKELFTDNLPLRYQMVDGMNAAVKRAPWLHTLGRSVLASGMAGWTKLKKTVRGETKGWSERETVQQR